MEVRKYIQFKDLHFDRKVQVVAHKVLCFLGIHQKIETTMKMGKKATKIFRKCLWCGKSFK